MNGIDLQALCDTNKLPDAIIAASAITLGLPIITADKQFEKIPGLSAIIVNR